MTCPMLLLNSIREAFPRAVEQGWMHRMVDFQRFLVPWQGILSPLLLGLPVLPIPDLVMWGHPAGSSLVLPVG